MLKIVGYTDRMSVRPGDSLAFKVSCEAGAAEYDAEIVRLICGDDSPNGPGFKAEPIAASINGRYPGRKQRVSAGSFANVGINSIDLGKGFTVAALIFPTWLDKCADQAIMACHADDGSGWSLLIDAGARACIELFDGKKPIRVAIDRAVPERRWSLLIATVMRDRVAVAHRLVEPLPREQAVSVAMQSVTLAPAVFKSGTLTIAAEIESAEEWRLFTRRHFDGKIE